MQNGFEALGETMGTPTGLRALMDAFELQASLQGHLYGNDPSSIALGTASNPIIDYVEGDLTMNGGPIGYGILVVTGTLIMGGDFHWYGPIFVVGDRNRRFQRQWLCDNHRLGLGSQDWDNYTNKNLLNTVGAPISPGTVVVATASTTTTAGPESSRQVPFIPPPSTAPLKILSTRTIP